MQLEQKHKISDALIKRMEEQGLSLEQVSKMSKAGNASSISDVKNKKYTDRDHQSDKIFNSLAAWLGLNSWVTALETTNTKFVFGMCKHLQRHPQGYCLISEPGLSKTESLKAFARSKETNVVYIECDSFWTRKVFLNQLLIALGKSPDSGSIPEMFDMVVETLRKVNRPLVLIDEADKLKDGVIDLFNALYNKSEHRVGFILAGAPYLAKRIEKGCRLNKQSMKEIYSRVGGEFHVLSNLKAKDIKLICEANGIDDVEMIQEVVNAANNDIRRVRDRINKLKTHIELENAKQSA